MKKECKHIWEHKEIKGICANRDCKKIHLWLVHKCKKCGIETCGGKIGN